MTVKYLHKLLKNMSKETLYYKTNLTKEELLQMLDELPQGWHKLGEQFIDELWEELDRSNLHETYEVHQVKEKYGSLHWYDAGGNDETNRILYKYEEISYYTCCICGKTATWLTNGWICPYCDDCLPVNTTAVRFGTKALPFYSSYFYQENIFNAEHKLIWMNRQQYMYFTNKEECPIKIGDVFTDSSASNRKTHKVVDIQKCKQGFIIQAPIWDTK